MLCCCALWLQCSARAQSLDDFKAAPYCFLSTTDTLRAYPVMLGRDSRQCLCVSETDVQLNKMFEILRATCALDGNFPIMHACACLMIMDQHMTLLDPKPCRNGSVLLVVTDFIQFLNFNVRNYTVWQQHSPMRVSLDFHQQNIVKSNKVNQSITTLQVWCVQPLQ